MIVSRLVGGLGNQMFQYAAGRALALRRGVPFRIDRRTFDSYKTHAFGLNCFRADLAEAPAEQLPDGAKEIRINRLLRPFLGGALRVYAEKAFTYDPEVLRLPDRTYLDGYWQSEKYFADCADAVRQDFIVRHAPSPENQQWLERIAAADSVSLHVRRGDYVTNASAAAVHGTCDLGYYQRAVDIVRQVSGRDLVLFVFSDDPDWAAANLQLPFEIHLVRNNNAATNYEDLRLMSACRNHVIANSSFSWWGAWLNPSPSKIVVAPQRWFLAKDMVDRDLIPETWLRA